MQYFVEPPEAVADPAAVLVLYRYGPDGGERFDAETDTWLASATATDAITGRGEDIWSCGSWVDPVGEAAVPALQAAVRARLAASVLLRARRADVSRRTGRRRALLPG